MSVRAAAFASIACLACACSSSGSTPDGGGTSADAQPAADAQTTPDAQPAADAAAPEDAAPPPEDAGCQGPDCELAENTTPTCTDRLDNDGDTYVDCKDFDCRPVNPCNIPENDFLACTDGMDNDGDDYVDCTDFNCRNTAPCNIDENATAACTDTFDNDGDGDTDCADSECAPLTACDLTEDSNATCSDGADNDGNQLTDCMDPACSPYSVCDDVEDYDAACGDGADNDRDQLTDCADDGCAQAAPCNLSAVRVATWNVQTLGATGSPENDAVRAVIARVAPDVACFQEVEAWETGRFNALAVALAYPYVFQSEATTPMAGGLTTGCISRYPIVDSASLSSHQISSDANANETGRDIGMIRVELMPASRYLTIYSLHLKSGFEDADYFRRQVEIERVAQSAAAHLGDAVVIIGDFNEELGESTIGTVFNTPPSGLPSSYHLGNDVTLPLTYDPFSPLTALGLAISDPTHEDSTNHATRIPSGRRIDYLLYAGATLIGDEVYNPCRDDGVDDPPAGDYLPLAGNPLPCNTKEIPSDHRMVFADLGL